MQWQIICNFVLMLKVEIDKRILDACGQLQLGLIEAEVRKSATEAIKEEVRKEIEPEYKDKLAEAEARAKTLDTSLRRKTIAAEYGLKAEFEEFLGDGSDEDMRAKADVLKTSPVNSGETKAPEKQGKPDSSDSFVKFIGDTD